MEFVKIRSWHAVKVTTRDGGLLTYCGQYVLAEGARRSAELPAEKSCEACLRITTRNQDRG